MPIGLRRSPHRDRDSQADRIASGLQSAEAKEAMTAFFEKRKPDFSRF